MKSSRGGKSPPSLQTCGFTLPPSSAWNYQPALVCRSLALFAIIYQIHLIARDLSDTPVFIATITAAFLIPFILIHHIKKPLPALVTLLLIPIIARFFISLPRYFLSNENTSRIIQFDTLLLNFDRNNFVALFPFYWIAISSFFSCRVRRFARFAIVCDCLILALIYSFTKSADIVLYRLPVVKIAVFTSIVLLQLFAMLFSSPPALKPRRAEKGVAIAFIVMLCLGAGALLIRPLQESALEMNGGLMQPKIFSFDFAPFLRLENEIKMSDDLIFIVRKNSNSMEDDGGKTLESLFEEDEDDERTLGVFDDHFLMRRFVLSRYNGGGKNANSKNANGKDDKDDSIGFLRDDILDEISQSAVLPRGQKEYAVNGQKARSRLNQEYYLVNIDGSAFIAMNEPEKVIPFESWDASSFKSAYSVSSMVSNALPIDLYRATESNNAPDSNAVFDNASSLGLSDEELAHYTDFGNRDGEREKRITELAQNLTRGKNNYWEKIQTMYQYLKYGEYRYSLKPGIAPSGDQLTYFIFDSKKGYCSYFAFAFAAMLRSIDIPCRVAVGFFLDLNEDKLGFFPVRSNMAHAWVEVWYPDYGWIEYDPTTDQTAEGEQFDFSQGFSPDIFERLMKEILDNHNKLQAKEGVVEDAREHSEMQKKVINAIKSFSLMAIILCIIICFIFMRYHYAIKSAATKNNRKKTIFLWAHVKNMLRLCGYKKKKEMSEDEWALELGVVFNASKTLFADMCRCVSAAKFAKEYQTTMQNEFNEHYKTFLLWHKNAIPLWRRILSIVCPPAALALKPSADRGTARGGAKKNISNLLIIVFTVSMFAGSAGFLQGDETDYGEKDEAGDYGEALVYPQAGRTVAASDDVDVSSADSIYHAARQAQGAEFWERAIDLYSLGKANFPGDQRFPLALGNLYFSRELYRLAMNEFLICEKLNKNDTYLLYLLAQTAGNLNENKLSAHYYERLLAVEPDDRDAIGALGWMYFKLHRLDDGEALLKNAIDRFGDDPDFLMTLATIYSDMLDYENGKRNYLDSIEITRGEGYSSFASVAYYNLSILESRFYNFDDAYRSSMESIALQDRSSGHLARGELHLRRLDFKETLRDYEISYEQDNSPLTKVNMALAYLCAGRLAEAIAYSYDCLNQKNLSWMLNYGIDPDSYKRDLYEIIYKSYTGLAKTEKFILHSSFKEKIKSSYNILYYRFQAKINKLRYRKYSSLSTDAIYKGMSAEGQLLEALKYYYLTFNDYQKRALYYLNKAEDIEENFIPKAMPTYLYEAGKMLKSDSILRNALDRFDPVWEQDMIAEAYTEIAMLAQSGFPTAAKKEMLYDSCGKLFAMNGGALRQHGLRLPINLQIAVSDETAGASRLQKNITRALNKAGFTSKGFSQGGGSKNLDARFSLNLTIKLPDANGDGEAYCELFDKGKGMATLRKTLPLKSAAKKDIAAFVNTLAAEAFVGN